ncbi:MAG: clostripain-related cysteine peptidase [bacterium]|nr:clostripain-related cysteine peptidase [bacterium]
MKKLFLILAVTILIFSFAQAKPFALLIYICGDNNLSSAINDDIDEIENAYGSLTANLDILICVDGHASYGGYVDDGGTRTDTRYYHLTGGGSGTDGKINDLAAVVLGEKNMADPTTLINFADWVDKNYKATNYGLIMWNHGAGWAKGDLPLKGGMSDETDDDFMSGASGEWRDALEGARAQLGKDFYFIGCDMCVMAYMEVLWDMYDISQMMVVSEANIPFAGWYYDDFILSLATSAPTSHAWLGHLIVNDYKTYYGTSTANTLTYNVVNDMKAENGISRAEFVYLKSQIFSLAQYLIVDEGGRGASDVQACIDGAQEMSSGTFYEDFKDIYHFCSLLNANGTIGARVKSYAVNIMAIIDKMNPEDWQAGFSNAKGLGIYLPDDANIYYFEAEYDAATHPWGASSAYNGSTNGACWPWTNFIYGQTTLTGSMYANSFIDYDNDKHEASIDFDCSSHYVGVQISRNNEIVYESPSASGKFIDKLGKTGKFDYEVVAFTMTEKTVIARERIISSYSKPVLEGSSIKITDSLIESAELFDVSGKRISFPDDVRIIDTKNLPSGTYYLLLNKTEKHRYDIIK